MIVEAPLASRFNHAFRRTIREGEETDVQILAIINLIDTAMRQHTDNCIEVEDSVNGSMYKSFMAVKKNGLLIEMSTKHSPHNSESIKDDRLMITFFLVPNEEEKSFGQIFRISIPTIQSAVGEREADRNAGYRPEQLNQVKELIEESEDLGELIFQAAHKHTLSEIRRLHVPHGGEA